jgi:hypothetical protein
MHMDSKLHFYLFSCPFQAGLALLPNEFMWAGLASVRW